MTHSVVFIVPLFFRKAVVDYAIIDPEDYPNIGRHRWRLKKKHHGVQCWAGRGSKRAIFMHRELLGLQAGDGLMGDHINGNGLDNRRANLRIVTRAQNQQNRRGPTVANLRSHYRGVYWDIQVNRWHARVFVMGKCVLSRTFRDERSAAEAARQARLQYMPFTVEREVV